MKNLIIFLLFLVCIQLKAQTFDSYEGAAENKRAYHPINITGFKPLSSEEDTMRYTGVFHGPVAGGVKFAWLENELVVFNKNDGKISRIYACGNAGEFIPPVPDSIPKGKRVAEEKIPLSQLASYLKTLNIKGEKGDKGDKGEQGLPGKDSETKESPFSFWHSPYPYIIGGVIVTTVVVIILHRHNNDATPIVATGKPPGGFTGPSFSIVFRL